MTAYVPRKNAKKLCGDRKMLQSVVRFRKRRGAMRENYSHHEAIEHIGGEITTCYLTGEVIDIRKDDFHLDHIYPVSRGGDNSLENLGITVPYANRIKYDMTVEEMLEVCTKILTHNGYEVTKK